MLRIRVKYKIGIDIIKILRKMKRVDNNVGVRERKEERGGIRRERERGRNARYDLPLRGLEEFYILYRSKSARKRRT